MDNYSVSLSPKAQRDIEEIWNYIAGELMEESTASGVTDAIEASILSLESFPYRCPERKVGVFANRGYRQMLAGNYTVIYRVNEEKKNVTVLTVVYSGRNI